MDTATYEKLFEKLEKEAVTLWKMARIMASDGLSVDEIFRGVTAVTMGLAAVVETLADLTLAQRKALVLAVIADLYKRKIEPIDFWPWKSVEAISDEAVGALIQLSASALLDKVLGGDE